MARLDDGSFLSRIGDLPVRVVSAQVTVTCADGTTYTSGYRLATTLADHRRYPAAALIRLYHDRWEHESAYLALRHTLLEGRVLRSADSAGLEQEIWALLALYQALADGILASGTSPAGRIGRAVLDDLLPPRRARVSARKVKSPLSRWNNTDPHRPARSTPTTSMTITVSHPAERATPRHEKDLTARPGP
jgi:hypothetical protein